MNLLSRLYKHKDVRLPGRLPLQARIGQVAEHPEANHAQEPAG
jgi:hypothetical protein